MSKSFLFANELIKKYKWQSIFIKYWKTLTIIFILPLLLINGIAYFMYNNLMEKEYNSSLLNSYKKSSDAIEKIFSDIDIQYSSVAYSQKMMSALYAHPNVNSDGANYIYEQIRSFITARDYLKSIHIYSLESNYVYSSQGGKYLKNFSDKGWYEYYTKNGNSNFIIPEKNPTSGRYEGIVVCYGIHSGQKTAGLIIFKISSPYITKLVSKDLDTNLQSLTLIDSSRNIIYSSQTKSFDDNHPLWEVYDDTSDNLLTKHGKNDVFLSRSLRDRYLTLIFDVNDAFFNKKTIGIQIAFSACFILLILIPIFMSLYISMVFYKNIHQITVALNSADDTDNQDEISYILNNIMKMTLKNKSFEKELAEKISLLKKTQTMALQLQFNPHFLFNTLNMINVLVCDYADGDNDASKAIVLLSDLLYASMNTNDYIVTLDEELSYEEKYIEIMRLQYDNRFDIKWDISPDTLHLKVFKLMLHPIIENSFRYGLKLMPPEELFVIKIESFAQNEMLTIRISNNGKGLEEEKLIELKNSLENDDILQSKHIGLNNINQRIKILFGDNYGLNVSSDDTGFSTTIILPCE